MAATARLEVRVSPQTKACIERAAALARTPVSEFVRSAAEDRAEEVMAAHESHSPVPPEFFDDLLAALDSAAEPSAALARAAERARSAVRRA